MSKAFKVMK